MRTAADSRKAELEERITTALMDLANLGATYEEQRAPEEPSRDWLRGGAMLALDLLARQREEHASQPTGGVQVAHVTR